MLGDCALNRGSKARIIVWSGILLIVLLITMLPSANRFQAAFNRARRDLRQRANKGATDGAAGKGGHTTFPAEK